MAQYQYRCFPVPTTIQIGNKDPHGDAVRAYEEIINKGAQGGWEYVGIDTVSSFKQPGCMGILTGKKDEAVHYKILIFKKLLENT